MLAFQYGFKVLAVDSCAHHADVTNARAALVAKFWNSPKRSTGSQGYETALVGRGSRDGVN